MKPKEKAQELFNRFYDLQDSEDLGNEQLNKDMEALYEELGAEIEPYWVELAKNSALIAVNDILYVLNDYHNQDCKINQTKIQYWQDVKQELEKL